MKTIILLLLVVCLSSCGSTKQHCPTYAQAPATDSLATVVPNRFSNAEKTGAVLFTIFVIYAINKNKEESEAHRP